MNIVMSKLSIIIFLFIPKTNVCTDNQILFFFFVPYNIILAFSVCTAKKKKNICTFVLNVCLFVVLSLCSKIDVSIL